MRYLVAGLACLSCCSLLGCSTMKSMYKHQEDAISEYHDDWKSAGTEGRGEMPREKETDKLTPLLQSPQARAIEKNLGYD
jgi:hypothetical protein